MSKRRSTFPRAFGSAIKRLKNGAGDAPPGSFKVCCTFADGESISVSGIYESSTLDQLRQKISAHSGRAVSQLFDESDEEQLVDCRRLSGSSCLIGVEAVTTIVVAESLGAECTDVQFQELCHTGSMASQALVDLGNLTHLTDRKLSCLRTLPRMRELCLHNCRLNLRSKAILKSLMYECSGLTSLDISANALSAEGVEPFATALAHNRKLVSLNISLNNLGAAGAELFEPLFETNRTISSFTFSGDFKEEWRKSQPVTMDHAMTEALFAGKNLGPGGAALLAAYLPRCQ